MAAAFARRRHPRPTTLTEAFAQQAYTAVGNRDREIMRDPYMLGFEIVTKNEENTRLVGVFAFRVSGEILLVPVFYLNGQIKGQDLLYRKGVNRFVPNTDKWVSYLLSRGEDGEGRGGDRRALDARIHLDLRQLGGSRIHKSAADDGECEKPDPSADFDPATQVITVLPPDATTVERAEWEERGFIRRPTGRPIKVAAEQVDIKQLWKEAMDAWQAVEPRQIFAEMLVETGMQKQAAELAAKLPIFAEMIEVSGALKKQAGVRSQRALEKLAMISWGGGQYLAGNKNIGAELGYTNLLGTVPLPQVGIRGGTDRFGLSGGMAGIFPYVGMDFGGVAPGRWQRNTPRGLPDVMYDKFKKQRPVDLFGRTLIMPNQLAEQAELLQKQLQQAMADGDEQAADQADQQLADVISRFQEQHSETGQLAGTKEAADGLTASPEAEKKPMAELLPADELVKTLPPAESPEDTPSAAPKQASVRLFTAVQPGWSEPQLEEFYKQGFALRDSRDMKYLSTAYVRSDVEQAWSSVVEPGVRQVTDVEGRTVRCLWAPVVRRHGWAENDAVASAYRNDRRLGASYQLLLLDGPDKGRSISYRSGTTPADIPVFKDGGEVLPEDQQIKGKKPTAGGTYAVWLPSLKKILDLPFIVRTIKKSDGRTVLNAGTGDALVVNSDLTTNERDLEGNNGLPRIVGSDAQFIPVACRLEYSPGPRTPENISWATAEQPTSFRPLLTGRMDEALLTTKTAAVELRPAGRGLTDVLLNGRRRAEDLNTVELVWKLAAGLHLPAEEAIDLANQAKGAAVRFEVISPAQQIKLAAAYSGRTTAEIAANRRAQ